MSAEKKKKKKEREKKAKATAAIGNILRYFIEYPTEISVPLPR